MTAKEYLQQLHKIDIIIQQKMQERSELQKMSVSIGSFDYTRERVQTSPSNDAPYAKTVDKIVAIEAEIDDMVTLFADQKHRMINQIQSLQNDKYIDILYKYYVENKRLEQIAAEMNYTYQYIRELHRFALQEFETTYTNLH